MMKNNKNKKCKSLCCVCALEFILSCSLFAEIIPYGNGAWVYDTTYKSDGSKGPLKPGLFVKDINDYNLKIASCKENQINQIFAYGGDIENSVDKKSLAKYDNSNIYYYPPQTIGKNKNWQHWSETFVRKGASGFASSQAYTPKQQFFYGENNDPLVTDKTGIDGVNYKILVIDGRVDSGGYLRGLNIMSEDEARGLAQKVAMTICADNSVDGVQFDIEPFSFKGGKGGKVGEGQKYFYQEIAKCFAGWFSKEYGKVKGINRFGKEYDLSADLINAVNKKHPYGRFFSVFSFSDMVTPDVLEVYDRFENFYIIDSLYDLENVPAAQQATSVENFRENIKKEIQKMKKKGIPYQFAIPAAASCHEFESCDGRKNSNINSQLDYVKAAVEEIQPGQLRKKDRNFKGIAIWSWTSSMWWNKHKLEPAKPPIDVLQYLGKNIAETKK